MNALMKREVKVIINCDLLWLWRGIVYFSQESYVWISVAFLFASACGCMEAVSKQSALGAELVYLWGTLVVGFFGGFSIYTMGINSINSGGDSCLAENWIVRILAPITCFLICFPVFLIVKFVATKRNSS